MRVDRGVGGTLGARHRVAASGVLLAVAFFVACAREDAERAASRNGGSESAVSHAAAPDTGCRKAGDWTLCAVEDRLVHAGVVIERQPDSVRHPFFSVAGVKYQVGNPEHEVEVYLYPTAAARQRDTEALDSATASPKGTRVGWRAPPTLVLSNNMAAVILTQNERTSERLALALGAGLPAVR